MPDLRSGNLYSRAHSLTAITLDGDKQDRKGSLTGGFINSKHSRLEAARQLKSWTVKFEADRARQQHIRHEKHSLDQRITELQGELSKLERGIRRAVEERGPALAELDALANEKEQGNERLERLQQSAKEIESDMQEMRVRIDSLEAEMKTPMRDSLTREETETLSALSTEVQKRKKEVGALNKDKQAVSGLASVLVYVSTVFADAVCTRQLAKTKSLLEIELSQNLRRLLAKARSQLDSLVDPSGGDGGSSTQANASLIARRAELDALVRNIANLAEKISNVEAEIDKAVSDIAKKGKELEAEQAAAAEDNRGLARQQKNVERYLAKRQILLQRRDESNQKIRDLGVLPEDAYTLHTEKRPVEQVSRGSKLGDHHREQGPDVLLFPCLRYWNTAHQAVTQSSGKAKEVHLGQQEGG